MGDLPLIDNAGMPYLGYTNSSNKAFSTMTQSKGIEYSDGYHNNVYQTPPSNSYYVDPYSAMVYYTYTPYNNPYNNTPTASVKNSGTNKHHGPGHFDLPKK
ncbi:hypothetical protein G6F42_014422 [Rhizopus arrhizus]|nr:hypothetical protein G6F42_014422 [Rhizopus arrhizus]